ncbi:DUF1836 domain-containing protein [Levilactobacillus spicheri]|uniref:BS_ykrK family protein n=2 Tax=Levilactobacillus spicheri TaxID=216463 RepID=A0A0F3RUF0_9LACO|nr:DUF1836 domain-containing protein [Levilactobacillus spicheri]KJW13234.1 BS_ykrK family protein [Levilactobacillus spicheri]KRL47480.1 BS ykrK family protein [Levilactobacillus spicheri DSM 15429]GEO67760.1 hypothetical protein LSP04_21790 [Levilactobacillus spicheri]
MADFNQYTRWEHQMHDIKLPRWDDLPRFDLYMDQVTALINAVLGPLGVDTITPAMINNYVKHKVILAPTKKKYQTMQLADILMISLLKPMFQTDTVRSGIDQITAGDYPKQAYDNFIDRLEDRLHTLGEDQVQPAAKDLNEKLMQVAVDAVVSRLQSEKLLTLIKRPLRKVEKTK